mmetsp:Transcript_129528/g.415250  ORF Transcript_129528/g.415250 Transcript_129528/m.415250 type:complete len:205 (-) Transcript_129528:323-937(-)
MIAAVRQAYPVGATGRGADLHFLRPVELLVARAHLQCLVLGQEIIDEHKTLLLQLSHHDLHRHRVPPPLLAHRPQGREVLRLQLRSLLGSDRLEARTVPQLTNERPGIGLQVLEQCATRQHRGGRRRPSEAVRDILAQASAHKQLGQGGCIGGLDRAVRDGLRSPGIVLLNSSGHLARRARARVVDQDHVLVGGAGGLQRHCRS